MKKYLRTISLLSILVLFLLGNQIFAMNPKAFIICEGDAGPDTLICGYEYMLPTIGDWEILCPENGAVVSLENLNSSANPVFTVSECGMYEIVLHDDNGMCQDTAIISFENPDSRTIGSEVEIDLELEIECLTASSGCGNTLTIAGAAPPSLNWEICASQYCNRTLYSTNAIGPLGDCLYDQIEIESNTVSTNGSACTQTLITGDNFMSTLDDLFLDSAPDCELGPRCFESPPPTLIPDTAYLSIPVLTGGQWHYFNQENILIPLMDSTIISIQGTDYLLVIEPGSDYYGPGEIIFTIFETNSSGEYIPPTTKVELEIQYVLEYTYELVEYITYQIVPEGELGCPNTMFGSSSFDDIPLGPENPCDPINLNFGPSPKVEYEYGVLNCAEYSIDIEVCPGEFTSFESPGEFTFSCTDENGCPYEMIVIIDSDEWLPYVEVLSYECDPSNDTYTAEILVDGSPSTIMEIQGLGSFDANGSMTVSEIPSCVFLDGYVWNLDNGCYTNFTLNHCCECVNTQSSMDAVICEGESYDILNQSFTQSGNYEVLTTNSAGCDSLITLSLEMLPVTNEYFEGEICDGADFVFYNQILTEPGLYFHFGTNANGCQEQHTLNLEVYQTDDVQLTENICEGETYDFFDQQLGESGQYIFDQEDPTGCVYRVVLQLEVISIPEYFESVSICQGGSIDIGGELISTAGTYSVVDYDNLPCGEIFTYEVSILEAPLSSEAIILCKGESFPLGNDIIQTEGIYVETFTNASGCDSIIQIDVRIDSIDFEMVTIPSCLDLENGSIQIGSIQEGTAPFTYSLDGSNFTDEELFENLPVGSYSVQVMDQNLCAHTKQVTIEESPELMAEIQDYYELTCEEPSLNLAINIDESTEAVWSTGNLGNEIFIDEVGAYSVMLRNSCQDKMIEFLVEEAENDDLDLVYIPNAFSPNQDEINDEFKIYYATAPTDFQLEVYDRWGNKVFYTNDPDMGWSGVCRNNDMLPGVYVYKLEAVINSCLGQPKSIFKKGDVTLMK